MTKPKWKVEKITKKDSLCKWTSMKIYLHIGIKVWSWQYTALFGKLPWIFALGVLWNDSQEHGIASSPVFTLDSVSWRYGNSQEGRSFLWLLKIKSRYCTPETWKIMYFKYNHCSLPWGLIFLFSQYSVGACSSPAMVAVSWASLLIHWHVDCCSCSSFVHMCMCVCLSLKNYVHLESTLLEANWAFPFKSKWMWSEGKAEDYHMVEDLKEQEIC